MDPVTDRVMFRVFGTPAPKGSKTAFVRNGRAVVVEGASASGRAKLSSWTAEVARESVNARPSEPFTGPVFVAVDFYMPRPKSAPKGKQYCDKKPDLDKLVRATYDAMTGVIFQDDSQVVGGKSMKLYATAEEPSGAVIRVYPL